MVLFTLEKEQFRFESINTGPGTAILATLLYEVVPFSVEVGQNLHSTVKRFEQRGKLYSHSQFVFANNRKLVLIFTYFFEAVIQG